MSTDFSRVPFYTWQQKKRRAKECLFFREDMMVNKDSTTTHREFVKRVGAVAGGATLFLGQSTLSAHAESSQERTQRHPSGAGINVLLVHGAFVDASSWSKVIPLLQARGYHALAVQNPLTSLEDDVTTTSQALASLSGPTILVGHSYGGNVISNVGGTAQSVLSLVDIAAYAPEEGESVQSINAQFPPPPVVKYLRRYRLASVSPEIVQ